MTIIFSKGSHDIIGALDNTSKNFSTHSSSLKLTVITQESVVFPVTGGTFNITTV